MAPPPATSSRLLPSSSRVHQRMATMLYLLLTTASLLPCSSLGNTQAHKNVILLIADDMRPEMHHAYGQPWMVTPELDKLAQESLIFDAAFTNCAICAASRNSFMSGRMPDTTRTWNFIDDFRTAGLSHLSGGQTAAGMDWTSLPEFFSNQGYYTAAHGKVFHNNRPRKKHLKGLDDYSKMVKTDCPGDVLFCPGNDGPKDKSYSDYKTAKRAIKTIKKANGLDDTPLFLAAGLHFPHLTWAVPDWSVNEYDFQSLTIAQHREAPVDCPDIAFTAEFDGRTQLTLDMAQYGGLDSGDEVSWPVPTPNGNEVPEAVDRFLRLGYYSAITFADSLFGKILDEVDDQQMKDDTLVIFTSDHGFSLGEQGEWGKHTLFDNSLRIPLMIRAPWIPGCTGRTSAFFELIDLYRTTVSLAGIDSNLIEEDVAGVNQAALISAAPGNKSSIALREAAYAQYSRCPQQNQPEWYLNNCEGVPASEITVMGYSVRENTIRFTEWYSFTNCVADFDDIIATEVYVQQDPRPVTAGLTRMDFDEVGVANIVADVSASELHRLRTLVRNRFDTGINAGCPS